MDANVGEVDAYMNRVGLGPSNDDPRFAWERPSQHPWNQKVVQILSTNFKNYASTSGISQLVKLLGAGRGGSRIEDYEAELDKIADIHTIIADKLLHQQSQYRTLMRKLGSFNGRSEKEVKETLKADHSTSLKIARQNERKRNVRFSMKIMFGLPFVVQRYLRRAIIINEQLLQANEGSRKELWKALELIFSHLREEDMSSDDTETERTFHFGKVVRRVRKFWISEDVTKVL